MIAHTSPSLGMGNTKDIPSYEESKSFAKVTEKKSVSVMISLTV